MATLIAELHRRAGVVLHPGQQAEPTEWSDDLVIAATGSVPNTEWLRGSVSWRPPTDCCAISGCAHSAQPATSYRTSSLPVTWSAGLTRWPMASSSVSGHWSNAVDQAETAARNLLFPDRPVAFEAIPSFWSDLYDVQLRAVGLPRLGSPTVEEHDPDRMRLVVTYHRDSRLVGAVTVNRTSRLARYRTDLNTRMRQPRHLADAGR